MDALGSDKGLKLMDETQEEKVDAETNTNSENFGQDYQSFLRELEQESSPEKKVEKTIEFMADSLSQSGTPNFRNFWDARSLCLDLFKLEMPHPVRSGFWSRYTDLTKEARRLKEILNEQSSFAAEQIELAIQSIEEEILSLEKEGALEGVENVYYEGEALRENFPFYNTHQKMLHILNALAIRINSLRKELIKTEMRVRVKNKFFSRLSSAGDHVFPRRKELVKTISRQFIEDVDAFISMHFPQEITTPYFKLREEIKQMQALAKQLTLNTGAFSYTRGELSKCWDRIKDLEKEKRKERAEKSQEFRANAEPIEQKIQEFIDSFAKKKSMINEAYRQLDEIQEEMRHVELGRDDVRHLRGKLSEARGLIHEVEARQEEERHKAREEKERVRQLHLDEIRVHIQEAIRQAPEWEIDHIVEKKNELISVIQTSVFTKKEKMELEREAAALRDQIALKKEERLKNLPQDHQKALEQLREALEDRVKLRNEVKEQLDDYRKESGSSNLDFEQAMKFNDLLNQEKERLDTINTGIEDLRKQIEEYENGT